MFWTKTVFFNSFPILRYMKFPPLHPHFGTQKYLFQAKHPYDNVNWLLERVSKPTFRTLALRQSEFLSQSIILTE